VHHIGSFVAFVQVIALAHNSANSRLPDSYTQPSLDTLTLEYTRRLRDKLYCDAQEIGRNSMLMLCHLNFACVMILHFPKRVEERWKEEEGNSER